MALLIGMDEAGYGPNLGPLIVGATAWEIPGDPRQIDLWQAFAGIVDQGVPTDDSHIQIADSKQVYSPARGIQNLGQGVLRALALHRHCALGGDTEPSQSGTAAIDLLSFKKLCGQVGISAVTELDSEPWFAGADLSLPATPRDTLTNRWQERCQSGQIRLRAVRADVVLTRRFNEHTRATDSKGRALSEISMSLLRRVWDECSAADHDDVLILADKHGGRNRYHDFLPIVFDDRFIRCLNESQEQSRYRVGNAEVRFETKSERHLPVALASMVCKYLRELAMNLFNRFWTDRQPGLKPTAGYPNDAVRFKAEIEALQQQLGITDDVLWRQR